MGRRHTGLRRYSRALTGVVLSANDPVAAWGGVEAAARTLPHRTVHGDRPSTDNQVGIDIIDSS